MARVNEQAIETVEDFVSLAERLRALVWARLAVAVAVMIATLSLSRDTWHWVGICGATYALMFALDLRIRSKLLRNARPSWRELVAPMLVESLATMTAIYLTGGTASPVRYALVLQGVSTALLLSHKIAIRNAVWVSLLLFVSHEIQELGLIGAVDQLDGSRLSTSPELWGLLGAVWAATLLTGSASAVNERGLRRERLEQHVHASFGQAVEEARDAEDTAAVLAAHVLRTGSMSEALVVALHDGKAMVLGRAGGSDVRRGVISDAEGTVLDEMRRRRSPVHVRHPRPGVDDALISLVADATHVSAIPLITGDDVIGAIIVVYGREAERGVHGRMVLSQQRLATHGALALANAWAAEALDKQARTDGLTGLANRRVFNEQLANELERSRREHSPLSLLMVDVDAFKLFNDTHGHQVGDQALVDVAKALGDGRRPYDVVARYGGEEFAVILPQTDHQGAILVAERLRRAVSAQRAVSPVTASFGVATTHDGAGTTEQLLAAADRCLYQAKANGRDRVEGEVARISSDGG